ncbi:DUF5696 domain-containing protein [Paenibacillus tarimensis]
MTGIRKKSIVAAVVTVLLLAAFLYIANNVNIQFKTTETRFPLPGDGGPAAAGSQPAPARLPADTDFILVAESEGLRLKLDDKSGHFIVEDKRNGNVYRSYPDPKYWAEETISETWKRHLASPVMVSYVDFSKNILQAKETNLFENGGKIGNVQLLTDGFSLEFILPDTGFTIPVEVSVKDDYVETKIVGNGIKETKMGLVWVRLYSFFGAEYTDGQDGYLFVPDGSGTLIRFKDNLLNVNKIYDEPVYGSDITFPGIGNNRNKIIMPVFGMKAGSQGYLAVIDEGGEYANIIAAPAGVLSKYNWVTAQMNYRASFLQFTTRRENVPDSWGYVDYNRDELFGGDRTMRYYLLDEQNDYVGMAQKYRGYLISERGAEPLSINNPSIPMYVTFIGADREKGVVSDRYIKLTTTEEAEQMVKSLNENGVKNMSLTFTGWQEGGYSSFGKTFPADARIGGDQGLKAFIDNAHRLGFPVYLEAEYALNNTGGGGFDKKFDGIANLAGRTLSMNRLVSGKPASVVSYKFAEQMILGDLPGYKALGADGIHHKLLGGRLFSDYNSKYGSPKGEARVTQERIFQKVKEELGGVSGTNINTYGLPYADYIEQMVYDNSYDLFSDESIPFAHIAMHGLVAYSSNYVNNRQEDVHDFLRDIEYGAVPSFIFTHAETKAFVNSYGLRYYNTYYPDWDSYAAEQYKRYNEALGDVQDQFITGHETLAPDVKQTTYANGKRIIVNYNTRPYTNGDLFVPARDYVVIRGGSDR